MCDSWCNEWVEKASAYWNKEAEILDVGTGGVLHNGTVREICRLTGKTYTGTDMQASEGVDVVINAENILAHFGPEKFDVVISTEMLEHCEPWREAVFNMLSVLKLNGILVLTTRSKGFMFHEYPSDYWRFEVADLRQMFLGVSDILYTDIDRPDGGPGCGIILRRTAENLEAWRLSLKAMQVHDIRSER